MKEDVKFLLSVSLAEMKQLSSLMDIPLALLFNICDNTSTSTTFDVSDGSISIVEGVLVNSLRWLEELF